MQTKTEMQEKLEWVKQAMSELNEVWDNEEIEYYPSELGSFDELLIAVSNIKLK